MINENLTMPKDSSWYKSYKYDSNYVKRRNLRLIDHLIAKDFLVGRAEQSVVDVLRAMRSMYTLDIQPDIIYTNALNAVKTIAANDQLTTAKHLDIHIKAVSTLLRLKAKLPEEKKDKN
jgi:hypothetical protein